MSTAALLAIQEDFVGRLMAEPVFSDVAIILQRKNLTESEINQRLQTVAGRNGKIGACILVQMPVLDVVNQNLPGPDTTITQSLVVIEHPTLNAQSKGTGKSAEYLSEQALRLFHHFVPFGVAQVFKGAANAIVPADLFPGLLSYVVTLTSNVRLAIPPKVSRPVITGDNSNISPSTITMTCVTPTAVIWYTTDGSYPASTGETALQYTAPFAQVAGATIRAAAEVDGFQQSDIAQITIAAGTVAAVGGEGGEAAEGEGGENLTAEG